MTGAALAPAGADDHRIGRDALVVTLCTLASRLTGFVRVLVAAACLGVGVLGDTYGVANTVPNLLFELLAGGVLQAVLVPVFVAVRRDAGDDALGRAAGAVLGWLSTLLLGIVAVALLASPLLAHLLTAGDDGSDLSADKRTLVGRMLLVFIPQVLFYGLGVVATAALAAQRRFMAAALAPAVNNVVVITCYLLYRATLDGEVPGLHLSVAQFALVAGGTTLAVVAFTGVPGIVLTASGVRWRPRWEPRGEVVTAVRRGFGWAMLSVAGTLLPTGAAMVLGYDAEGGVAVFSMTFAFFVLPHALIAVPMATAVAPRVADAWQRRDLPVVRSLVERTVSVVAPLLLLAAAGIAALAWPIARAASFGDARLQGIAPIAHALAVFGLALPGYGLAFVATRLLFSIGEVRAASITIAASAVLGVVAMAIATKAISADDRAAALAVGYGVTHVLAACGLGALLRRRAGAPHEGRSGRVLGGALAGAGLAAAAMVALRTQFGEGRAASVIAVLVAGAVGVAVFVAAMAVLGGVRPVQLIGRGRAGAS